MLEPTTQTPATQRKTSDITIDGLLSGLAAGIVMAVLLVAAGLLAGDAPASVLARFDPAAQASALTGLLAHLAVSGIYGLIFGVAYRLVLFSARLRSVPAWAWGGLYGLALLGAALFLLPLSGSAVLQTPMLALLVAHLGFGLSLGALVGRNR